MIEIREVENEKKEVFKMCNKEKILNLVTFNYDHENDYYGAEPNAKFYSCTCKFTELYKLLEIVSILNNHSYTTDNVDLNITFSISNSAQTNGEYNTTHINTLKKEIFNVIK